MRAGVGASEGNAAWDDGSGCPVSEVALSGAGNIEEIILRRRSPASDCWMGIPVSAVLPPACVHKECENSLRHAALHAYTVAGLTVTGLHVFSRMPKRNRWAKRGRLGVCASGSGAVKCGWNMSI